jgi:hypothetical protein
MPVADGKCARGLTGVSCVFRFSGVSCLFFSLNKTREISKQPPRNEINQLSPRAGRWLEGYFDFLEFRMPPFLLAFSVECTGLIRSQERFTASSIGGTLLDLGLGVPPAGGVSQLVVTGLLIAECSE